MLHTLQTDSVNRYGYRFSVGALVRALHDNVLTGQPCLVSHDFSRPIGWTRPLAVYVKPGLSKLMGVTELGNDSDRRTLARLYENYYRVKHVIEHQDELDQLYVLLDIKDRSISTPIMAECVALIVPGIARRCFPNIFSLYDDDGLIPVSALTPLGPGVYRVGKLVLFAHHFFRRNQFRFNVSNDELLSQLHQMSVNGRSIRIALDPDMVGLASSYVGSRKELAYWWGPYFNDNLASMPSGVTCYAASDSEQFCHGISGTQFRWGSRNSEHIFEAEELRNRPSAPERDCTYRCRYVHSIVDEKSGLVRHFDGAIRAYSEEEMSKRLDQKLDTAGRHTVYTKLWRFDGELDVASWKRLLSNYFKDNFTVGEYLGSELEDPRISSQILESGEQQSEQQVVIPFSMLKGSGIRVALSYRSSEAVDDWQVGPIALETMTIGDDTYKVIESEALELIKAMSKLSVQLTIPHDIVAVTFRDFYANFPLMYMTEEAMLEALISGLQMLTHKWLEQQPDMVLCYKVGFPVDAERLAVVSVIGHVSDIVEWLDSELCIPPMTNASLIDWMEKVSDYVNHSTTNHLEPSDHEPNLMVSGLIWMNREPILTSEYDIEWLGEDEFGFKISGTQEKLERLNGLMSKGIVPAVGMIVLDSECSQCKSSYHNCTCSKVLDNEVVQEIINCIPFPFLTDRPY